MVELESRARRLAKKHGFIARKSRWRRDSIDNFGEFQLIDARGNFVVGGLRFDMSADEVIQYCKETAG